MINAHAGSGEGPAGRAIDVRVRPILGRYVDDDAIDQPLLRKLPRVGELWRVDCSGSGRTQAIAIEPVHVLWDLVTGAATAGVAIATEEPISQAVAIANAAGAAVRELKPVAEYIFGCGAIDLAR